MSVIVVKACILPILTLFNFNALCITFHNQRVRYQIKVSIPVICMACKTYILNYVKVRVVSSANTTS